MKKQPKLTDEEAKEIFKEQFCHMCEDKFLKEHLSPPKFAENLPAIKDLLKLNRMDTDKSSINTKS